MNFRISCGPDLPYERMLVSFGHKHALTKSPDFVLFTGGYDVNPALYHEQCRESSYNLYRDSLDIAEWTRAFNENIPCIGICRGAQFLNVMCGGTMRQHIENHAIGYYQHHPCDILYPLSTSTQRISINSTHHQEMVLPKSSKLIAHNPDDGVVEGFVNCEFNAMGVQWHPEEMPPKSEGLYMFQMLTQWFLEGNVKSW